MRRSEVVEDGPSLAGRLLALAAMLTIKPTLAIGSYAPRLPWPFGLVDVACRVLKPAPGTVRATISLPNCNAQLVRAAGVLPADGKRRIVLYMHGGAFLTCGVNSHGRLVETLSKFADSPVLVVNYRMIPKHSVGQALDDCYDAYKWLRLAGYDPEQIVLAGDSAGGYLSLALAERLQQEGLAGESPAAIVTLSPLFEIDNEARANHPNIRSDAMFPPKAFTALVELVQCFQTVQHTKCLRIRKRIAGPRQSSHRSWHGQSPKWPCCWTFRLSDAQWPAQEIAAKGRNRVHQEMFGFTRFIDVAVCSRHAM